MVVLLFSDLWSCIFTSVIINIQICVASYKLRVCCDNWLTCLKYLSKSNHIQSNKKRSKSLKVATSPYPTPHHPPPPTPKKNFHTSINTIAKLNQQQLKVQHHTEIKILIPKPWIQHRILIFWDESEINHKWYLNTKGTLSLRGMASPKKAASSAICNRALRTISPKYIPEISFSNIWRKIVNMPWISSATI